MGHDEHVALVEHLAQPSVPSGRVGGHPCRHPARRRRRDPLQHARLSAGHRRRGQGDRRHREERAGLRAVQLRQGRGAGHRRLRVQPADAQGALPPAQRPRPLADRCVRQHRRWASDGPCRRRCRRRVPAAHSARSRTAHAVFAREQAGQTLHARIRAVRPSGNGHPSAARHVRLLHRGRGHRREDRQDLDAQLVVLRSEGSVGGRGHERERAQSRHARRACGAYGGSGRRVRGHHRALERDGRSGQGRGLQFPGKHDDDHRHAAILCDEGVRRRPEHLRRIARGHRMPCAEQGAPAYRGLVRSRHHVGRHVLQHVPA